MLFLSIYRKIASSNMSRLEAHAGFFRLLMKGIFSPYAGNALVRVQRVHKPADLWDITFYTR